jgi:hypothetical protein
MKSQSDITIYSQLLKLTIFLSFGLFFTTSLVTIISVKANLDTGFTNSSNQIYNQEQRWNIQTPLAYPEFRLVVQNVDNPSIQTMVTSTLQLADDNRYFINGIPQGTYQKLTEIAPTEECPYERAKCEFTSIPEKTTNYLLFLGGEWSGRKALLNTSNQVFSIYFDNTENPELPIINGQTITAKP